MNKLNLLIISAVLPLALSACQSSSANAVLLKPDRLQVPPLADWIRTPTLSKTSRSDLQLQLNGSEPTKTPPLTGSTPALQPTMQ